MARLQPMPLISLAAPELAELGKSWNAADIALPKSQGEKVGSVCDRAVGRALAAMLGMKVEKPLNNLALLPPHPDCVEVGPTGWRAIRLRRQDAEQSDQLWKESAPCFTIVRSE